MKLVMKHCHLILRPEFPPNVIFVPVKDAEQQTNISEYNLRELFQLKKIGNKDYLRVKDLMEFLGEVS